MSWAVTAYAAVAVGTAVYSSDQSRKARHEQQDLIDAQMADDVRKKAEAETSAQVAANARLVDSKRRRRSSALALGDPGGLAQTLGGSAAPVTRGSMSTALGAGAPRGI
jgi:hypothetical protein